MDKNSKIIAAVIITISIIIAIGIACVIAYFCFMGYVFGGYPYEKVLESNSPEAKYTVEIIQKDARGFFGPSDVIIKANCNNNIINKYIKTYKCKSQIYDDGGKGKINIKWKNKSTAVVTLMRMRNAR